MLPNSQRSDWSEGVDDFSVVQAARFRFKGGVCDSGRETVDI